MFGTCSPSALAASVVARADFSFDGSGDDSTIADPVASITTVQPSPKIILPSGYVVRVYEPNAIDAAADDLIVTMHYEEFDV